jgi:plastocyanin
MTTAAAIGLVGALLVLSPATPAGAEAASVTSQSGAVVNIVTNATNCAYFCFSPGQTTVAVGESVTFTNKTTSAHTVARCSRATCGGVSGGTGTDSTFNATPISLPPGKSAQHAFSQPGTYVYFCTVHGYALMHGTITVTAAAPTTTVTTPATSATTPTPPAAGPTPPAQPQLAFTGTHTLGSLALALILIAVGLTAWSFRPRRRCA